MNIKDFITIIVLLVLLFILGTLLFGFIGGLALVFGIHILGTIAILINFMTKPYVISITKKDTGKKEEIGGFKKFLILLGFSLIWEYIILINDNSEV